MMPLFFYLLGPVVVAITYWRTKNVRACLYLVIGLWCFYIWPLLPVYVLTLAGVVVLYRRIKMPILVSLVLGLLWTCINFYIDSIDADALFAQTPLGHLVTYPVAITAAIVAPFDQIQGGSLGLILFPPLMYVISFFIIFVISLPFYILSLIINRKRVIKENDNHDQDHENT